MGTPASVVSDSPGRAAPAVRARKRASANIFQGVGLRELRSLFRSGGAERPEERARLVWRHRKMKKKPHAALHEKECLEEVSEILQGKISLLEDQLAKLEECSTQENREVMADILKLEELKQEVFSLAAKRTKLQAMVLWLKEKQLQEAALQSDCGHFEEGKQQLGSLISSL